jgi:hypothetical protein
MHEDEMPLSLATVTADDFERHNGETFRLSPGELELKLVETKRIGAALRDGGAFSLLFVSAAGPFLPQAIYRLAHPGLGTLELFLVPLGPMHGGNGYEAVFT